MERNLILAVVLRGRGRRAGGRARARRRRAAIAPYRELLRPHRLQDDATGPSRALRRALGRHHRLARRAAGGGRELRRRALHAGARARGRACVGARRAAARAARRRRAVADRRRSSASCTGSRTTTPLHQPGLRGLCERAGFGEVRTWPLGSCFTAMAQLARNMGPATGVGRPAPASSAVRLLAAGVRGVVAAPCRRSTGSAAGGARYGASRRSRCRARGPRSRHASRAPKQTPSPPPVRHHPRPARR